MQRYNNQYHSNFQIMNYDYQSVGMIVFLKKNYCVAAHSRGVMPVTDLKLRKKEDSVLNPDCNATLAVLASG